MWAAGGVPQLLPLALFHVFHPEEALDPAEGVDNDENAADERADFVLRGASRAKQRRSTQVGGSVLPLGSGDGSARIAPRAHILRARSAARRTCM